MRYLILFLLCAQNTFAYMSTLDTADAIGKDKHKITGESQYIYNDLSGINGIIKYDWGFSEDETAKFEIGSGSVNFHLGAHYKYSPVPDIDGQPAIGGFVGIIYATKDGRALTTLKLNPIISKKFSDFTPYIALPVGVTFGSGSTTVPFQFVLGTEWRAAFLANNWFFTFELGSSISQSQSYASLGFSHIFD